jgi:NAD-dependent deacetylase
MKGVMILSGAGLSAESGIKTFRDNDGLWENYDVQKVCSVKGWLDDRDFVTQFYNKRRLDLADKKPNKAHFILAELEKELEGKCKFWNLTQNVDDLLEKAGCKSVIHLHGTLRDLRCEDCNYIWDIGYTEQKPDEICPKCKSQNVRHNVVMFGESAPAYRYIYQAINSSDLFIAIGTSGQVIDIVSIAMEFRDSVLINPKRERHISSFGDFERFIDEYFKIFIQKSATQAADDLYEIVMRHCDSNY